MWGLKAVISCGEREGGHGMSLVSLLVSYHSPYSYLVFFSSRMLFFRSPHSFKPGPVWD